MAEGNTLPRDIHFPPLTLSRWTLVADVVHSRSADQCAKRWQQSLDPDLDRSEWRDWEDKLLLDAMKIHGRRWKDIQRHHFPGRSKNCIKNRYTVLARKCLNQGTELPQSRSTPKAGIPHQNDAVSKSPSARDDSSLPGSQVSTPDFSDFCSVEDDIPVSFWDTPPPIAMGLGTSINEYSNPIHQQPTSTVSQQDQWHWTSMSMSQPICTETSPSDSFTNFQQNTSYIRYDDLYTDSMTSSPSLSHHHEAWNELLPTSSPSAASAASMHPDLQGMFQYATDQNQQAQHDNFYNPLLEAPHNDRQSSRGRSFLSSQHS